MDAFYVALYPYSYAPSADTHVSFEAGDVFVLKDNSNAEWWLVSPIGSDDREFYVPANYIETMRKTPEDENQAEEAVTPQADFFGNRLFADLTLGVQQQKVAKVGVLESGHEEGFGQVGVEVKQQQHNQTPDEHQSTDSGAIDGGLGSCDSLSTDSELSPNKIKHVDSGADSIDSMSNLPSDSVRNSLMPPGSEQQPMAANRRLLHSPIFANGSAPQSEEVPSSSLIPNTEDQSNAPRAAVRSTKPIVRPSTHMEPDTRNSIADLLNDSNDSDDAPRAKPRTFSLAQEVSTRKDSRSQSTASIGRQSTLEKYPKKSNKAPLPPPVLHTQQPTQTKKKSLKEKLSGTISAHHSKTRSEIEPMAGGDIGVERSSFRKSLDDLITPENFHFKDNQLSNGTGMGSVSQSVMSSTFSIATTTAAAGGAPSMDCLCLTEDEGDQYSSDDLLRSESMGCFIDDSSSKTPFAFFEKVDKGELSDYPDTCSSRLKGKSSNRKDVLREGVLYKKVETENSKSLLSWPGLKQQGKCFVQLTERALLFFKDKKHAQQSGCGVGGVAQSRPEHSFELFASNIEWRRGKKNTFQLWCDFMPANKVLLKSANPYDAAQWYDAINRTILNLKTGVTKMDTDFDQASLLTTAASIGDGIASIGGGGTGMFGSNSTLNRNNHYKKNTSNNNFYAGPDKISYRKEKSNDSSVSLGSLGSQTTLSSTSGVRNCLAQLLKSRPSVDALRKKGILKSAPVFGCVLEVRSQTEKRLVPEFVLNGMREVERRGLDIEGIYRLCGNMAEIQKLRFEVDKNSGYNLSQVNDIHVITGALKMYFRELPESLFPSSSYQTLADTFNSGKDTEEMADIVRGIVSTFSRTHQAVILHLFTHLLLVVENQQLNKMDSTNVAIVFGPNLIFPPDHISMAASVATTNSIMQLTLSHLATIFPPQVADGLLDVAHSTGSLRHSHAPSPTSELYRQLVLKGNNNNNLNAPGTNSNASSRVSSLHLLGALERGSNSPWDESPTSGFDPVI